MFCNQALHYLCLRKFTMPTNSPDCLVKWHGLHFGSSCAGLNSLDGPSCFRFVFAMFFLLTALHAVSRHDDPRFQMHFSGCRAQQIATLRYALFFLQTFAHRSPFLASSSWHCYGVVWRVPEYELRLAQYLLLHA